MAGDKKLSELNLVGVAAQTDLFYVSAAGAPRAITRADMLKVVDSLSSTSAVNPLAARQGAALLALINGAIRQGNYDVLQAEAAGAPTVPFLAVATMPDGSVHGIMHLLNGIFIDLGGGISSMTPPPEVG